jgi:hypothetical protein
MTYTFKYQLKEAPSSAVNGTGVVSFLIDAIYSTDGINYVVIPGFTRNLLVPFSELKTIMDMPHGTGPQKTAKTNALKEVLKLHTYTSEPLPRTPDWSIAGMSAWVIANDSAKAEANRANAYITVTLAQTYPVPFVL